MEQLEIVDLGSQGMRHKTSFRPLLPSISSSHEWSQNIPPFSARTSSSSRGTISFPSGFTWPPLACLPNIRIGATYSSTRGQFSYPRIASMYFEYRKVYADSSLFSSASNSNTQFRSSQLPGSLNRKYRILRYISWSNSRDTQKERLHKIDVESSS